MKMRVSYFNQVIDFKDSIIPVLEIENKKCFYNFINQLLLIENGELIEEINFFHDTYEEVNGISIKVVLNYFDMNFDNKRINNSITKLILSSIESKDRIELSKYYKKICERFSNIFERLDFSLSIQDEFNLETFIKILKVGIQSKNSLIDNLFLLIDVCKYFDNNHLIVFVNLKQYLDKTELKELYKYSVYNGIRILLIDSQAYGVAEEYEGKLLIDDELDEFVL